MHVLGTGSNVQEPNSICRSFYFQIQFCWIHLNGQNVQVGRQMLLKPDCSIFLCYLVEMT